MATLLRFAPDVLNSNTALCGSASFIDLFVTLIGSRSHVTNPYIRGKLVKVLRYAPILFPVDATIYYMLGVGTVFTRTQQRAVRPVL